MDLSWKKVCIYVPEAEIVIGGKVKYGEESIKGRFSKFSFIKTD